MIKAVLVFLLVMVIVGMIGKALFPGAISREIRKNLPGQRARFCAHCGRPRIGSGRCECGKG